MADLKIVTIDENKILSFVKITTSYPRYLKKKNFFQRSLIHQIHTFLGQLARLKASKLKI